MIFDDIKIYREGVLVSSKNAVSIDLDYRYRQCEISVNAELDDGVKYDPTHDCRSGVRVRFAFRIDGKTYSGLFLLTSVSVCHDEWVNSIVFTMVGSIKDWQPDESEPRPEVKTARMTISGLEAYLAAHVALGAPVAGIAASGLGVEVLS